MMTKDDEKPKPIPMVERWALDEDDAFEIREGVDDEPETPEEAALIDSWLEDTDSEVDRQIEDLLDTRKEKKKDGQ
jgi:hypothetical protein